MGKDGKEGQKCSVTAVSPIFKQIITNIISKCNKVTSRKKSSGASSSKSIIEGIIDTYVIDMSRSGTRDILCRRTLDAVYNKEIVANSPSILNVFSGIEEMSVFTVYPLTLGELLAVEDINVFSIRTDTAAGSTSSIFIHVLDPHLKDRSLSRFMVYNPYARGGNESDTGRANSTGSTTILNSADDLIEFWRNSSFSKSHSSAYYVQAYSVSSDSESVIQSFNKYMINVYRCYQQRTDEKMYDSDGSDSDIEELDEW